MFKPGRNLEVDPGCEALKPDVLAWPHREDRPDDACGGLSQGVDASA